MNNEALARYALILPPADIVSLRASATEAQRIETFWKQKLEHTMDLLAHQVAHFIDVHGELPTDTPIFDQFFMVHSLNVMADAMKHTTTSPYDFGARLAKPVQTKMPRSLRDLRVMYEKFKKQGIMPAKQKALADKVKKAFFESVRKCWLRNSEDFRVGKAFDQIKAVRAIKNNLDLPRAQAVTIVQTTTTSYYNETRMEIYDQSPDVIAWLYAAVRDFATTKWCKTRDGLVYMKTDSITGAETPSNHWNCRSEMLPLTLHNPRHTRLVNDKALARRNNSCEPLPNGWSR